MALLSSILAACIALILLFEPLHAVYVPGPNDAHQYQASVANFALTNATKRLEVSLFMPVKREDCTTECDRLYMPPEIARASDAQFFVNTSQSSVFGMMKYKVCCGSSKTIDASKIPIVIMEPQVGTSRFLYSMLARYIGANGVAVALIDHPHASATNGSQALDPFMDLKRWNETISTEVNSRIEDVGTVLRKLGSLSLLERRFPSLKFGSALDTSSYSVIGHGIGGTVATTLSTVDPRVRFSINLSGSAPLLQRSTYSSIYFFGRTDFRRDDDIHWPATWKFLAGKATEWDFKDAGIFDFSDLPWIADLARKDESIQIEDIRGLRDSLGPFGFHITACYLEGYAKAELTKYNGDPVGDCYRMFDQMQPYPGARR